MCVLLYSIFWQNSFCSLKGTVARDFWPLVFFHESTPYGPLIHVPDPNKGVCADPVNGAAILGKEGPGPQGGNKGRQLSSDKGRVKT